MIHQYVKEHIVKLFPFQITTSGIVIFLASVKICADFVFFVFVCLFVFGFLIKIYHANIIFNAFCFKPSVG